MKKFLPIPFIIIIGSLLVYLPFIGSVHLFDWDEINFAEIAREMIMTGDYLNVQIAYQPFWEKPPLFMWMQAISMNLFGINDFAARFPNAIGGTVTLLVLYFMGKRIFSERLAIFWVLSYAGSVLPFLYFKSGIIDPWFNLFIFSAFYLFHQFQQQSRRRNLLIFLSGMFIGLAILTKGPVAILVFGLSIGIYWLFLKEKWFFSIYHMLIFLFSASFFGGFWFILQIINGRLDVVQDFIVYQIRLFQTKDAGHGGFPLYHVVVLLLGVFPASIFAFSGIKKNEQEATEAKHFRLLMLVLFFTVLILFSIVKTKIIHYSSLCYFPLTFMAAYGINSFVESNKKLNFSQKFGLLSIASLFLLSLVFLLYIVFNAETIASSNIIKDKVLNHALGANVHWMGIEFIPGLLMLAAAIYCIIQWNKDIRKAIYGLYVIMIIANFSLLTLVLPKVEPYTQGAAIEFFKDKANKDVYVHTLGYKSFAHLFYARVPANQRKEAADRAWCANGPIDKPAFLSVKINEKKTYHEAYPSMQWLYDKDGYSFFYREPKNN